MNSSNSSSISSFWRPSPAHPTAPIGGLPTASATSRAPPVRWAGCSSSGACSIGGSDHGQASSTTGQCSFIETSESDRMQVSEDGLDMEDSQVVLSVVLAGGKVGVAYYDVEPAYLYIMPDVAEAQDLALLQRVLLQVGPSTILVSSIIDDNMQRVIKNYAKDEDRPNTCKVEILPSSDFKYESCKRRVIAQPFPGIAMGAGQWEELTDEQRQVCVSSLLPLESVNMVRALGVLLKYVDKRRLGVELEERVVRVPILALRYFSLESLMIVDENTYSALQIFQKECHPSVYKSGKGSTKEGLSLFGIANRTRSPLGRRLFKLWFMRPLCDLCTLHERHSAIEYLYSARNEEISSTLQDCIKHVKNIPRILVRMSKAHVTVNDWKALYKTTYNGILVGDVCRSLPQNISIFKRCGLQLSAGLHRVASLIDSVVDFEESEIQRRFCVKPNVDAELDKKRSLLHGLPDLMTKVAAEELQKMKYLVSECNVIYYPQLGFLLSVSEKEAQGNEQLFEELRMEMKFIADGVRHYKTELTREMDSTLGDTQFAVLDHENAILYRLQDVILEQTSALLDLVELTAELDCLLSLAQFAKEHSLVKPEFVEDNIIHIKGGRHPLQELCVSQFVPNDSRFDNSHGHVKVITGPNASGKSIYLKQNGLIVFLAHIGSFVPAEKARLGIVDAIHTRIQSRETVSVSLSTFMLDLNQVSKALNLSTARSLILLDEFGKGTATVDGLSLLVASINHFLSRADQCPHILVSTHFHAITKQQLIPESPLVEYLTMDTLQDKDELVFLYQLVKGSTSSSYACQVAAAMGLPASVIARGVQVTEMVSQNKPIPRADAASIVKQQNVCSKIVGQFMSLDLDAASDEDIESFLKNFVLPNAEGVL